MKLQLKKIGNSTGLILPKELLARLNLELGDEVIVSEGPDRSLTVTPHTGDDEDTMRIAREVMKEYANTLKALAK
jgi:putative addiction module antidote